MPKKVVKSKKGKGKKENLKEEFRKMLIESIMKDVKKKKVKECTSSCKPKKEVKRKYVQNVCVVETNEVRSTPKRTK